MIGDMMAFSDRIRALVQVCHIRKPQKAAVGFQTRDGNDHEADQNLTTDSAHFAEPSEFLAMTTMGTWRV